MYVYIYLYMYIYIYVCASGIYIVHTRVLYCIILLNYIALYCFLGGLFHNVVIIIINNW